jgi:hypothetical protein
VLIDALAELRAYQEANDAFLLSSSPMSNTESGSFVLRSYRFPVFFNRRGTDVDVSVYVAVGAGLSEYTDERARARDLSMEFLQEKLPDGYELAKLPPPEHGAEGSFAVSATIPLDEVKSEVETLAGRETGRAFITTRFRDGNTLVNYQRFLDGPPKPIGLAAIRKAAQAKKD